MINESIDKQSQDNLNNQQEMKYGSKISASSNKANSQNFNGERDPNEKELSTNNNLFTDKHFPPNDNSLYSKDYLNNYTDGVHGKDNENMFKNIFANTVYYNKWVRLSDLINNQETGTNIKNINVFSFISKNIDLSLYKNMLIKNLHFISCIELLLNYYIDSIHAIYNYPTTNLNGTNSNNSIPLGNSGNPGNQGVYGYYKLKFFINGQWKYIIIDDYVPLYIYSTLLTNIDYYWLIIIEKALIKVIGGFSNYYNMDKYKEIDYIQILTGFVSEKYYHNRDSEMLRKTYKPIDLFNILSTANCSVSNNQSSLIHNDTIDLILINDNENNLYTCMCHIKNEQDNSYMIKLLKLCDMKNGNMNDNNMNNNINMNNIEEKFVNNPMLQSQFREYNQQTKDNTFWVDINTYKKEFSCTKIWHCFSQYNIKNFVFDSKQQIDCPLLFQMTVSTPCQMQLNLLYNMVYLSNNNQATHPVFLIIAKCDSQDNITRVYSQNDIDSDLLLNDRFEIGNYFIWIYNANEKSKFNFVTYSNDVDNLISIRFQDKDENFEVLYKIIYDYMLTKNMDNVNNYKKLAYNAIDFNFLSGIYPIVFYNKSQNNLINLYDIQIVYRNCALLRQFNDNLYINDINNLFNLTLNPNQHKILAFFKTKAEKTTITCGFAFSIDSNNNSNTNSKLGNNERGTIEENNPTIVNSGNFNTFNNNGPNTPGTLNVVSYHDSVNNAEPGKQGVTVTLGSNNNIVSTPKEYLYDVNKNAPYITEYIKPQPNMTGSMNTNIMNTGNKPFIKINMSTNKESNSNLVMSSEEVAFNKGGSMMHKNIQYQNMNPSIPMPTINMKGSKIGYSGYTVPNKKSSQGIGVNFNNDSSVVVNSGINSTINTNSNIFNIKNSNIDKDQSAYDTSKIELVDDEKTNARAPSIKLPNKTKGKYNNSSNISLVGNQSGNIAEIKEVSEDDKYDSKSKSKRSSRKHVKLQIKKENNEYNTEPNNISNYTSNNIGTGSHMLNEGMDMTEKIDTKKNNNIHIKPIVNNKIVRDIDKSVASNNGSKNVSYNIDSSNVKLNKENKIKGKIVELKDDGVPIRSGDDGCCPYYCVIF